MFKVHRIITGATVTLLAAFGFIMIVWAHGRSAPPPARVDIATVRAVKLRLTFASGDSANVIQVEGAAINIEKDGKKLAITPFIHEQSGQVELRISEAVQRQGREEMQALDTLLVGKNFAKLNHGDVPLTVQVLDLDKQLPAEFLAGGTGTCCATTCNGTVVCGVCVCTDCGRCGPGWCDCAIPGPPDE